MKKLMTSVIILLPLLILAILLVSGAILSLVTHIYVESVEFVGNGALVLRMEDEAAPPTKQLEVNVLPLKAENRGLVYTVENENIATVDANGVVTAKFYGETYVTVTSAENKAASARRAVVVTDVSVHKLELNEDRKADLYEGETQELSVTVYPKEATNKSVLWSSSDESILRVGANGIVTAVGAGNATVTAVSEDNPEVTVSTVICCHKKLMDLEVDQTLVVTSLRESKFPEVKPVPDDADVTLTYKTDDPSVATVDGSGRISFRKEGRAVVTVTATDFGGKSVEKQKEYTSTDGYFLPPLFAQKEYTVDYDDYQNGEALPIPFAGSLEDSYREFVGAKYTVENVLTFDKETKSFRFANPMPVGTKTLKAEITARVYSAEQRALVEYEDYFFLTVLRNAQKISVSYKETADAAAIVIAEKTLSLSTDGGSGEAARVSVSPENHTDELSYELLSGNEVADLSDATLSFSRAGEATVKIFCTAENTVTAEKTVRVIYAPAGAGEKKVSVSNGQTEDGKLLLTMESETDRQTGVLYYTEPAGATMEYRVEKGGEEVISLEQKDGARRIVPEKGGFATVKITVTADGSAAQTYSVRVYVDCPVTADDLTVALGGTPCAENYGTTEKSVRYSVTVTDDNAAMAGKKLYVSYQSEKEAAEESASSHAGTIAFGAELSTLAVTFGVEYGDAAKQFGADEERLAAAVRTVTILRDAESVSLSYNGTDSPASVLTSKKSITFTTEQESGASLINVTVRPANHTNTIRYSVSEGGENASITRQGVLTFTKAGEATVKIELCAADGHTAAEKEILVAYAPLGAAEKEIDVSDAEPNPRVLLMMSGAEKDTGVIRFTEPADATVEYRVEKSSEDIVSLEQKERVRRIVPQKGGFATVKIIVTPNAGGAKKEYTVSVYVDRAVEADDFEIAFCDTPCGESFGTTLEHVPFTAEVNGGDGCMAGKKIYVSYGNRRSGTQGGVFSDEIEFSKSLGKLTVTFGVEYDEDAEAFGAQDGLSSVTRTLLRNAEEIAATYGGVQTVKIVIPSNTVSFAEGQSGAAFVSVTVSPAAHTDTLSYALEESGSGTATLSNGKLTFSKAGTVTVQLLLKRDGEITLQKTVTVTYEPIGQNEKAAIENGRTEPLNVILPMDDEAGGEAKEGVIYFTEPEGAEVKYEVIEGEDTTVRLENKNGVWHIVPVGGGFATVKITVSPAAAARTVESIAAESRTVEYKEYTVETYVDLPVKTSDFAVTFNGGPCADKFRTSLGRVSYSVTVADDNGSTKGKKLYVTAGGTKSEAADGAFTHSGTITFGAEDSVTVTFGVEYGEKAAAFGAQGGLSFITRTVSTSRGALDEAPTVTYPGGTLGTENPIEFADIGDEIEFKVKKSFSPADFDLSKNIPSIATTEYVKATVSADGETITLKALKPCKGQTMSLAIGSKTFALSVTVHAKADQIFVTYGGKTLDKSQYDTLLSALTFHVTIGRADGLAVDNKGIQYSLDNGAVWQNAEDGNVTANLSELTENGLLRFRSADEGANCKITFEKVALEEFGLTFSVRSSEGENVFGEIETVLGAEELSFAVPTDMQGFVTVKVLPKRTDLLGGFGATEEEFRSIISVDLSGAKDWAAGYVPEAGQIVLSNVSGEFRKTVKITCGEKTVNVEFSRINLERIEFTGFDSNNKVNGGDVYKGYQQVRVFAKQSVYGGTDVDYFRMPVQALNKVVEEPTEEDKVALSKLVWKFTSYNDKAKTHALITEQTDKTVKYQGDVYTIEVDGASVTLKKDGTTIVENGKYVQGQPRVIWVDPFSEADQGYVRIYFGGFTGLSETDVQNDYFGNFGEETGWKMPTDAEMYGVNGAKIEPSENAFSYLRLDGGDGARNSTANAHFNFNILEGSDLYNVFDATGYYAKNKVVLQADLYGKDELGNEGHPTEIYTEKKNNDQILDRVLPSEQYVSRSAVFVKNTIYGNGYQVNINSLNETIINVKGPNGLNDNKGDHWENNSNWSGFYNLYNVKLLGANPHEKLTRESCGMDFKCNNIYYSDVQYYGKMENATINIKNSSLRNIAGEALEEWSGGDVHTKAQDYLENVVMVNVTKGITIIGYYGHTLHFKGFFDVLNYYSFKTLKNLIGSMASDDDIVRVLATSHKHGGTGDYGNKKVSQYMEWFGNDHYLRMDASTWPDHPEYGYGADGIHYKGTENVFVNPIIIDSSADNNPIPNIRGGIIKKWDESAQNYVQIGKDTKGWNLVYPLNGGDSYLIDPSSNGMITAYTYDYSNNIDGGSVNATNVSEFDQKYFSESMKTFNATMTRPEPSKLFSKERYIRVLCQYLDVGNGEDKAPILNTDHILWHIQKCYRDPNLIIGRIEDHEKALIQSLKDARDSHKWDGEWPDGTTLDEALAASPEAAAMTKLLSETVVPSKYVY